MLDAKILQLLPAEGWLAIFKNEKEGTFFANRVTMWALIERKDKSQEVVGLLAGDYVNSAEESSNFEGYAHERGFGDVPASFYGREV